MFNILPENRSRDKKTSLNQNSRWRQLPFRIASKWKLEP